MTVELYWGSGSPNAWRVLLGAEIKGIPYESRLLAFSEGDLHTPEFRAMNPRGLLPVMRDGDFVLYESLAILEYLDGKHPSRTPLFGDGLREKAVIRRMISEFDCYLSEALLVVAFGVLKGAGPSGRPISDAALEEASGTTHDELSRLEALLRRGSWLVGAGPSAADVAVYPFVRFLLRACSKGDGRARKLGFCPFAETYPDVRRWMQRIEDLPGYERTFPPHWKAG
jgi:glutathione S-transferase